MSTNSSSVKFLRRAEHGSAIVGDFVYIDGGMVSQNYTDSNGEEQFLHSPNNDTLSIDLRSSWNTSSVSLRAIKKTSDVPVLNSPALWADNSTGSIYLWAGQTYDNNPPPSALWKFDATDSGNGTWTNVTDDTTGFDSLTRAQGGYSASTSDTGFYLGGIISATTDPRFDRSSTDFVGITGMVSYNWTTNQWSNDTAPVFPPYNTAIFGRMIFVPTFGSNGLLFALGGESPQQANPQNTENHNSFTNLTLYDPVSRDWYTQEAGGATIPQARDGFCLVGAQSQNNTFEIFLFGGWDPGTIGSYSDIYILSLPGFVWFKSKIGGDGPRVLHTCHVIGKRQMLSIGGQPSAYTAPENAVTNQWMTPDNFTQGLGIFDMTELNWTHRYDSNADAYDSPQMVKTWYTDEYTEPAWTSDVVRRLFVERTSTVRNDNESTSGEPTSGGSAASSSKGHESSKAGKIAGSVVGSIVGALILVSLALWFLRRRRHSHGQPPSVHEADDKATDQKKSELHGEPVVELPSRSEETSLHATAELEGGHLAELPHRPDEPPLQGRHELGSDEWPLQGTHELDGQTKNDST